MKDGNPVFFFFLGFNFMGFFFGQFLVVKLTFFVLEALNICEKGIFGVGNWPFCLGNFW